MNESDFFREVLAIVEAEFSGTRWTLVPDDGVLLADGEIEYGLRNLLASARFYQWSGGLLKQSVIEHFRKIIPAMHEEPDHLVAEAAIPAWYPLLSIPERSQGIDLFEELAKGLQNASLLISRVHSAT